MPDENQLNTVAKAPSPAARVEKVNTLLDSQATSILEELDTIGRDLGAVMDILTDRVVQSTEPGYPIALARIGELRVETLNKKIALLKTLVTDKGNELTTKKRGSGTGSELGDILSGVSLGAALGAKIGSQTGLRPATIHEVDYETIDTSQEEVIVETEHMNISGITSESIDNILHGE